MTAPGAAVLWMTPSPSSPSGKTPSSLPHKPSTGAEETDGSGTLVASWMPYGKWRSPEQGVCAACSREEQQAAHSSSYHICSSGSARWHRSPSLQLPSQECLPLSSGAQGCRGGAVPWCHPKAHHVWPREGAEGPPLEVYKVRWDKAQVPSLRGTSASASSSFSQQPKALQLPPAEGSGAQAGMKHLSRV